MDDPSPNHSFKSNFEDTNDSIDIISPKPFPQNAIPLQGEDAIEDDGEEVFDYDLLLPPPIPLPQKSPTPRDPIKVIYDYLLWKTPKFNGKEQTEEPERTESAKIIKNNTYFAKQKATNFTHEPTDDDNQEPKRKKLADFFADPSKIVYQRNSETDPMKFNEVLYNLRTQKRRNMAEIEIVHKNPDPLPEEGKGSTNPKALRFESRFESGNLAMAGQHEKNEYNLILQSDVNTKGFGQWFFFQVTNGRKKQKVKFNILNYRKDNSLHNQGMKVYVYSMKQAQEKNIGWSKTVSAEYFSNNILRENLKTERHYRTLSFEYTFKHDSDQVFFAYSQPYTYTDLLDYLDSVESDSNKSRYFGRSTLCKTIAGNKCELITITQNKVVSDCEKKKCIVLTSRVHPGEPNSSYIIQGVIDFLLSNSKEAESLREKFIFKIVPMLNPDGVIHGNSRCSLAGCDLNRKWQKPSPNLHPTVYYTKRLISELNTKYQVLLYCDFHGHSKKKDMFIYGCQVKNLPLEIREFAWVLSKVSPFFNYRRSTFSVESYKQGTARINLYQELKIKYSYTLETSFYGSEKTGTHYTMQDLIDFGGKFCQALLIQFAKEAAIITKKPEIKAVDDEIMTMKRKIVEEFYVKKENLAVGEEDSDSDSEVSEDEVSSVVLKELLPLAHKKVKKKSKSQKTVKPLLTSLAMTALNDVKSNNKTAPDNKDLLAKQKSFVNKPPADLKKPTEKIFERRQTQAAKDNPPENVPIAIPKKTVLYEETEYFSFLKPNQIRIPQPRKVFCHITDINAFHDNIVNHNEERSKKWQKDRADRFVSRVSKERKSPAFIKPMNFPTIGVNSEHTIIPPILEKSPNQLSQSKFKPFTEPLKTGRDVLYGGESAWDIKVSHNMSKDSFKKFAETQYGHFHRENNRDHSMNNTLDRSSRMMTKTRGAHTLEPLNKVTMSVEKNEAGMNSKGDFKGKIPIRHPGFQRRLDEESANNTPTFKETLMQKHILKSPSEIFRATGGLSNLIGTERFKQKAMLETSKDIVKETPEALNHLKTIRDQNDSDLNLGPETPRKTSLFKREQALLKHSNTESQKLFKDFKRPMLIYTTPRVWNSKGTRSVVASPVNKLGILNNVNSSLNGSEILKNIL